MENKPYRVKGGWNVDMPDKMKDKDLKRYFEKLKARIRKHIDVFKRLAKR